MLHQHFQTTSTIQNCSQLTVRVSGCYNTILEITSHDKVITKRLKQYAQSLQQIMQQALERGKAEGEFASNLDSKRMAKYLMNTNAGLQVTMKLSSSKQEFQALVEIALSILN